MKRKYGEHEFPVNSDGSYGLRLWSEKTPAELDVSRRADERLRFVIRQPDGERSISLTPQQVKELRAWLDHMAVLIGAQ